MTSDLPKNNISYCILTFFSESEKVRGREEATKMKLQLLLSCHTILEGKFLILYNADLKHEKKRLGKEQ